MSWINLVEVYDRIERDHGRRAADETLSDLRALLTLDLPGTARMTQAARIKATSAIALADCFAVATAAARGLVLLVHHTRGRGRGSPRWQTRALLADTDGGRAGSVAFS
jgi:hypothetical protein